MKKAAFVLLGFMFCIAAPSFAQSYIVGDAQDLPSDAAAIHKDNTAINHDDEDLAGNRAAKARAKANGDSASQAVDSVKIEANKATKAEKDTEKNVDHQVMTHDEQ
jgi:hypothetical protein